MTLLSTAASPAAGFFVVPASLRAPLALALGAVLAAGVPLLFAGRSVLAILIGVAAGLALALTLWPWPRAWMGADSPLRRALAHPVGLAGFAAFTAWLLAVALSIAPHISIVLWLQVAALTILIPLAAAALLREPAALALAQKLLIVLALLGGLVALVSLYAWPQVLGALRGGVATQAEAASRLKHYAATLPCMAPLLVWAGFRRGGAWRWAALAAVPIGIAVVIGCNNRAAMVGYGGIGLALGCAWLWLRLGRAGRIVALAAGLAIAGAGAALVLAKLPTLPFRGEATLTLPTRMVDAHRQVIWAFTLDKIGQRPVFGWGFAVSNRIPGAEDIIPQLNQNYIPLHPHNWVLQVVAETGLIGLAAGLVFLLVTLGYFAGRAAQGSAAAWAAIGLFGAFFVSGLGNFSIWVGRWHGVLVMLAAIVLAGIWHEARRTARPQEETP